MQKVSQLRQFLATAMPGQSWPADGGQHIDVVRLTTVDVQNSSINRQLEAPHGNGIVLGACIPNRCSILKHRTDDTTVQPLNKVSRSGTTSQAFQQKAMNLSRRMMLLTCSDQERVLEIRTPR